MKTCIDAITDYEGERYWIEGYFDEDDKSIEVTKALYKLDIDLTTTLDSEAIESFEYVLWDKIHNGEL